MNGVQFVDRAIDAAQDDIAQTSPRKTVNVLQACAIAGVCRRTINYWVSHGKIEFVHTAGGGLRIYADTLFQKSRRGRKKKPASCEK